MSKLAPYLSQSSIPMHAGNYAIQNTWNHLGLDSASNKESVVYSSFNYAPIPGISVSHHIPMTDEQLWDQDIFFRPNQLDREGSRYISSDRVNVALSHQKITNCSSSTRMNHILNNDSENLDSMISTTLPFSPSQDEAIHSLPVFYQRYGPILAGCDTRDSSVSILNSLPQMITTKDCFVGSDQADYEDVGQEDHDFSDLDAEGEIDPDCQPIEATPGTRSSPPEQIPDLETVGTGSTTKNEAGSDPNDSEYNLIHQQRRRTTIRQAIISPPTALRSGCLGRRSYNHSSLLQSLSVSAPTPALAARSRKLKKLNTNKTKRGAVKPSKSPIFYCPLMPYGCTAVFPYKNEWKRHVSTQHMRAGFWRCELCGSGKGRQTGGKYNDFKRKDLFTQHLKRMHADSLAKSSSGIRSNMVEAFDRGHNKYKVAQEVINDFVKRNFVALPQFPSSCRCPWCDKHDFDGESAWNDCMEHMASHFGQSKRDDGGELDLSSWRVDHRLSAWLSKEGLITQASDGQWQIGDGRLNVT